MSPRISVCALHRREGRWLLARRKPGGSQGGKWEFPGGKVEEGEDPAQALIREIQEELNLDCRVGDVVARTSFSHKGRDYELLGYLIHMDNWDFRLSDHDEAGWYSLQEMDSMDLSDSDARILRQLPRD